MNLRHHIIYVTMINTCPQVLEKFKIDLILRMVKFAYISHLRSCMLNFSHVIVISLVTSNQFKSKAQ